MQYQCIEEINSILSVAVGCHSNKEKRNAAQPIICVSRTLLHPDGGFGGCYSIVIAVDGCELIPVV